LLSGFSDGGNLFILILIVTCMAKRRKTRPRDDGHRPFFISPWDTKGIAKWGGRPRKVHDDTFPTREEYES
jgi:hypothetical protein